MKFAWFTSVPRQSNRARSAVNSTTTMTTRELEKLPVRTLNGAGGERLTTCRTACCISCIARWVPKVSGGSRKHSMQKRGMLPIAEQLLLAKPSAPLSQRSRAPWPLDCQLGH